MHLIKVLTVNNPFKCTIRLLHRLKYYLYSILQKKYYTHSIEPYACPELTERNVFSRFWSLKREKPLCKFSTDNDLF